MWGIINKLGTVQPYLDWFQRDIDPARETFVKVSDGYADYQARVPEELDPQKFFAQVPYLFVEFHEHTPWQKRTQFEAVLYVDGCKSDERVFWLDPDED